MKKNIIALSMLLVLTLSPLASVTGQINYNLNEETNKQTTNVFNEATDSTSIRKEQTTPTTTPDIDPTTSHQVKDINVPDVNLDPKAFPRYETKDVEASPTTSTSTDQTPSASDTYWVEAGANGDGMTNSAPAGNITYVMMSVTPDDIIKVKPGSYYHYIESYPLTLPDNVTLTSTGSAANTVLIGDTLLHLGASATVEGFTLVASTAIESLGQDTIIQDNIFQDTDTGIVVDNSNGAVIKENEFYDVADSIILDGANNTMVRNNTFAGIEYGIMVDAAKQVTVKWNTLDTITDIGIGIMNSTDLTVFSNSMTGLFHTSTISGLGAYASSVARGLVVNGHNSSYYDHNITTSNTVAGQGIHYYYNITDAIIAPPGEGGTIEVSTPNHITIADGENITIKGLKISADGVMLQHSNSIEVTGNEFRQSAGLTLFNTNTTNIIGNDFLFDEYGIEAYESYHNRIEGNYFGYYGIMTNYGLYMEASEDTLIHGNTFDLSFLGLYLTESSNNNITDNSVSTVANSFMAMSGMHGLPLWTPIEGLRITGNSFSNLVGAGVLLYLAKDCTIVKNDITGNVGAGIDINGGGNNKITANTITGNGQHGIRIRPLVLASNNNTIERNTISGNGWSGVGVIASSMNKIINNTISGNTNGVNITSSTAQTRVFANTISGNTQAGVYLQSGSSSNNVTMNDITGGMKGVHIYDTSQNRIKNNTVSGSSVGIWTNMTDDTTILLNEFTGVTYGIRFTDSTNNNATANEISGTAGFFVNGTNTMEYNHTIEENTVNGRTAYYYYNKVDEVYDGANASEVTWAYCDNMTMKNSIVTGGYGLRLVSTDDSTIRNSNFTNGMYGIRLKDSSYNKIIDHNLIMENDYGLAILNVSDATGVSINNKIYKNDFINNGMNAYDDGDYNAFAFTIGNYWSDYYGVDANNNGIGDTPYYIEGWGENADPLPKMWSFINDSEAPSVSLTLPEYTTSNEMTISWSATDNLGIDNYKLSINGTWMNMMGATSYTQEFPEGEQTIKVRAVDVNNNTATTDSKTFIVDTTGPSVSITSPNAGKTFEGEDSVDVTVEWSGSDTGSDIDLYKVRIDGKRWADEGDITSYEFTGLEDGEHTVKVLAFDNAGNSNSTTLSFNVDIKEPSGPAVTSVMWGYIGTGIAAVVIIAATYFFTQRRE